MSDEDPRALAKRLAAEAKARTLAKELADKAKAKALAAAPPAKKSLAERSPPPGGTKPAVKKSSLAERAPRALSAQEALKLAMAREAAGTVAPSAPKPAAPKPAAPRPVASPKPSAAPSANPAAPFHDAANVLAQRLPGAEVASMRPVAQRETFAAVWSSHKVRAAVEEDMHLLVTAEVLTAAAKRLPAGGLVAAEVSVGGTAWAVFIDTTTGSLLGAASPAALYLAGA